MANRGKIEIEKDECKGCAVCIDACPPKVIRLSDSLNVQGYHSAEYLGDGCTGCGICFYVCPEPGAISVYKWEEETPIQELASAVV
jgi:2-oxoglutarate ferredoxin oxidoreductase subunit delta